MPPGERSCGGVGGNTWVYARDASGAQAFLGDLENLRRKFPSEESRSMYIDHIYEHMQLATEGQLPSEAVTQLQIAPDVLEVRLPDWQFSAGRMHVRLYFSEPRDLPGHLVALRLRSKRPGPIGVEEQDGHILEASDLLLEFKDRGFT